MVREKHQWTPLELSFYKDNNKIFLFHDEFYVANWKFLYNFFFSVMNGHFHEIWVLINIQKNMMAFSWRNVIKVFHIKMYTGNYRHLPAQL